MVDAFTGAETFEEVKVEVFCVSEATVQVDNGNTCDDELSERILDDAATLDETAFRM